MYKMMLIAGCGGFAGTCCRYVVCRWCSRTFEGAFPAGTFVVNMAGCFLIGLFIGMLERNNVLSTGESALLVTGFCGGFTTFSTFANDVLTLGGKGEWTTGILYVLLSVVLGLIAVWCGRAVVR